MVERIFYLEQLENNYWGLEGLMHQSEALTEIETLSKDSKFLNQSKNAPYFNRWHVVWITLTHPFYSILSTFSSAMVFLSSCVCLPKASRIFTVLSNQLTRDWQQLCGQWEFQSPLLVPATNAHQLSSWDVYQHGDIPYSSIQHSMVQPLTFPYTAFENVVNNGMEVFYQALEKTRYQQSWLAWIWNRGQTVSKKERRVTTEAFLSQYRVSIDEAIAGLRKKYFVDRLEEPIQDLYGILKAGEKQLQKISTIPLFSSKGNCRGGSLWFIFLYHRTLHLFKDPAKHLMAIAGQFKTGMPRQAALLHAFNDVTDLLKLKKREFSESKISLYELDYKEKSALEKIQSLPLGIYRVGTYHHSLVYVKSSKNNHSVWNPEFGLYPMNERELLKMIREHHYVPGHPDSMVYFERYENAESLNRESA